MAIPVHHGILRVETDVVIDTRSLKQFDGTINKPIFVFAVKFAKLRRNQINCDSLVEWIQIDDPINNITLLLRW
ncbi:hypothetical protein ATB98_21490 [Sinorhizobium saheli]|uniref:Uncharacterized protein n=1 Tax=Sinorhizobium saheli TaxID=36856 RepID=A0A178XXY0_SINSA|nr:hypothetical protein ATB98_21490 [Sinorhizobium saheli]